MAKGIVKWFNHQKGFGFITSEDGKDVFVHHSVIEGTETMKTLTDGEEVEVRYEAGPKGCKAISVKKIATIKS